LNILISLLFFLPLFSSALEKNWEEKFQPPDFKTFGDTVSVNVKNCINIPEPGLPILPTIVFREVLKSEEMVDSIDFEVLTSHKYKLSGLIETAEIPYNDFRTGTSSFTNGIFDAEYPVQKPVFWTEQRKNGTNYLLFKFSPCSYSRSKLEYIHFDSVRFTIKTFSSPVSKSISPPVSMLERGNHEYVILTTSSLVYADSEYSPQSLLEYRHSKGFSTNLVTVDWIYNNYIGTDGQMKIREFCKDAYLNWGTRYLLILGGTKQVPVRMFLYSGFIGTLYMPQDQGYYGNLDGDFDNNQNGIYGEENDGENGNFIDCYSEIKIGRLPAWEKQDAENMIRKTIQREESLKDEKFMFCGEEIQKGISSSNNILFLFPNQTLTFNSMGVTNRFGNKISYDTFFTNIVDQNTGKKHFNSGYSLITHIGHGADRSCYGIDNYNFIPEEITNSVTFLFYSVACSIGGFDKAETTGLKCWTEAMLSSSNGIWAAVVNQRDGWYSNNNPYYSVFLMRLFFDDMLRETSHLLGDVYTDSKERMVGYFSLQLGYLHFIFYSNALFGDPASVLFPGQSTLHPYPDEISVSNGLSFKSYPLGLVKTAEAFKFKESSIIQLEKDSNRYSSSDTNGNYHYRGRLTSPSGVSTDFYGWVINTTNDNVYTFCRTNMHHPPPYNLYLYREPFSQQSDISLFICESNLNMYTEHKLNDIHWSAENEAVITNIPPCLNFSYFFKSGNKSSPTTRVYNSYSETFSSGGKRLFMQSPESFGIDNIVISNRGNSNASLSIRYDLEEDMKPPYFFSGFSENSNVFTSCSISNIYIKKDSELTTDISGLSSTNGYVFTAVSGTNIFFFHSYTNISGLKLGDFISTRMLRPFTFSLTSDSVPLTMSSFSITDINRLPKGMILYSEKTSLEENVKTKVFFAYFPSLSDSLVSKIKIRFLTDDYKKTEHDFYWKTIK